MQSDEQAIRQLVETWLRASQAGDTKTVLRLMADDVVFLVPGQPPMTKAGFKAAQSGLQPFDVQGQSEIQEIQVCGEWAYIWTKLSIVVTPKEGGAPVRRAGNTLSILRKQDGAWVMYRDANLLAVVPDPE